MIDDRGGLLGLGIAPLLARQMCIFGPQEGNECPKADRRNQVGEMGIIADAGSDYCLLWDSSICEEGPQLMPMKSLAGGPGGVST